MIDLTDQIFSALATILIVVIFISAWLWIRASLKIRKIDEKKFSEEFNYWNRKIKVRKIIFLVSLAIFIVLCIVLGSILGINKGEL